MIPKGQLDEMFAGMAAQTNWDLSKPLLWGYFFRDGSKSSLESASELLVDQGYSIVEISFEDKEDPSEPDVWVMHAEKVEVHTSDSLFQRNSELEAFAEANDIASYDGMDVGPLEANE